MSWVIINAKKIHCLHKFQIERCVLHLLRQPSLGSLPWVRSSGGRQSLDSLMASFIPSGTGCWRSRGISLHVVSHPQGGQPGDRNIPRRHKWKLKVP